jgi:hypothetical protein
MSPRDQAAIRAIIAAAPRPTVEQRELLARLLGLKTRGPSRGRP